MLQDLAFPSFHTGLHFEPNIVEVAQAPQSQSDEKLQDNYRDLPGYHEGASQTVCKSADFEEVSVAPSFVPGVSVEYT